MFVSGANLLNSRTNDFCKTWIETRLVKAWQKLTDGIIHAVMIENEYGSLTGPPKNDIMTTNMCISASLYNDPNPKLCINFGNINFVQKFVSLASLYMSFIFFLRRVISCLFAYDAVAVLLRIVCMKLMQERHRALAR